MELKVGMYVRTKHGIGKIKEIFYESKNGEDLILDNYIGIENDYGEHLYSNYIYFDERKKLMFKCYEDIIDLIQPQDLLYIDIDDGYQGGIIVPRIPETIGELENVKKQIKEGTIILKGILTKEQLNSNVYRIGE